MREGNYGIPLRDAASVSRLPGKILGCSRGKIHGGFLDASKGTGNGLSRVRGDSGEMSLWKRGTKSDARKRMLACM